VRQRLATWGPGVGVAAGLIALVAWSFLARWQLLTASPFPLGVDGYFYPIQLRALLDHGALAYPAPPLAFYLLAPFAAATDPITGAKLGAALWGAAIALPAYGVGARLGGGRGAGLVAAALATTSVGSAYLTIEFVKNGVGLTVALTALWLLLRAAARPAGPRIAAAGAGLVAAYATHKMAAAIVLAVAIPVALAAATEHGALRGRRLLYAITGLTGLAAAALAIGAAFPERFLSAADAKLWADLVSATPRWSAPALALPTGELTLGYDALLGLVLALAAVIALPLRARIAGAIPARWRRQAAAPPAHVTAATWPILVIALAIGLPFLAVTDRQGLGFRLRIAAFVPAALAAAIAARAVLAPYVHRDAALTALAFALALARQPATRLDGEIVTHPALVAAAQALSGRVPAGATLIVPERHIAFLVAWYTGAAVAIRPEGVPPARRYRLLPLHFIGEGSALDHQLMAARAEPALPLPIGVHPRHPDGLVLVAEPTWAWILAQLPPEDRAYYAAWPTL
jgi:hypothetical protein